jgi:membrane protein DedA with SNARE-associated domain
VTTPLIIFVVIFLLNLAPAFAPPTWMAMSYLGVTQRALHPALLAVTGATAATLGRISLAKLSRVLIRQKLLGESARKNVDAIKDAIEGRKKWTAAVFLFYAFSPLPSNQLFLSYGMTSLPLRLIAVPFFFGRFVSYTFWAYTASTAVRRLELDLTNAEKYLGAYFVVTQILLLLLVYLFARVDWRALLVEHKWKWHKES